MMPVYEQSARGAVSRRTTMSGCAASVLLLIGLCNVQALAQGFATEISNQRPSRYFTVKDSIEMSRFGTMDSEPLFSPDNRFFSIVTSRGVIKDNTIESTLWVFRSAQVRHYLRSKHPSRTPLGRPLARFTAIPKNSYTVFYASIISRVRWQWDSRAVLFLGQNSLGERQLYRADLNSGGVRELTPKGYDVSQYEALRNAIVYVAAPEKQSLRIGNAINADALDLTGVSLASLLPAIDDSALYCEVWVIRNGRRRRLRTSGLRPIHLANHFPEMLSISPDGKAVVVLLPIDTVPISWELYLPTNAYLRLRPKDPSTTDRFNFARPMQYAVFELDSGKARLIMNGPHGYALGYVQTNVATWSPDSKRLLLTNTFLTLEDVYDPERSKRLRPCACAIVDFNLSSTSCIAFSHYSLTTNSPLVSAEFGRNTDEAVLAFDNSAKELVHERYQRDGNVWQRVGPRGNEDGNSKEAHKDHPKNRASSITIEIREAPNTPPALYAAEPTSGRSRKIWDPNPGLSSVSLGQVTAFHWIDRTGYDWLGQLIKPPDYVVGRRYPLVIQTYGFADGFVTDGFFPTASAARPLAAAGIMVLQMRRRADHSGTAQEAPDQMFGFEAAIERLTSDDLVDPEKVGIVGFSRTCYHVESALISEPKRFAAATIADGMDASYLQYLYSVGDLTNVAEDIYGVKPFGAGLKEWVDRAPGFNLDRVRTPLRIEAIGFGSVLAEWETYGSLLTQGKPVDLIYFPFGDHLLQKPLERMASQQGNVDWFRFWLKGEEDPDPSKATQYARWRKMREQLSVKQGS